MKSVEQMQKNMESVRMKVLARCIQLNGLPTTMVELERPAIITPFKLLEYAAINGMIDPSGYSMEMWQSAKHQSQLIEDVYAGQEEGIGSSDMYAFALAMVEGTPEHEERHNVEPHKLDEFANGGEIEDNNTTMLKSLIQSIKHHSEEIDNILNDNTEVMAWVLAKAQRAATDLSDITHYLEGQQKIEE
jgi:hypothetical protein